MECPKCSAICADDAVECPRCGVVVAKAWWAGQNLLDLAPYIADARALQLVLLGGRTGAEVEGHDWEYLLGEMNLLHMDRTLALAAHRLELVMMAAALMWAAVSVRRGMA